jgi:hypothetical protein
MRQPDRIIRMKTVLAVTVRSDRYPRHFQGSRSSTFVIL